VKSLGKIVANKRDCSFRGPKTLQNVLAARAELSALA